MSDLYVDLRDGNSLITLLEVLTNKKYVWNGLKIYSIILKFSRTIQSFQKRERGRMRVHHINNINNALNVLAENGVRLLNISSEDIVGGNQKLTLGLIWNIALSFDGQKLVSSEAAGGLEKHLLAWVRRITDKHGLNEGRLE